MNSEPQPRIPRTILVAAASIVVAAAVMAIKYVAYLVTGSVALYSDALESIVNVMTAVAALIALQVGSRPPDKNHPFGHHKAEFFSAIFEGAMIIVAAVVILIKAVNAMRTGVTLEQPGLGLAINAAASALNAGWAWLLISRGRAWRSPALTADGWHLFTDVITSAGVLVGLILATLTGWLFLDPLLAAVVAINILWTGYRIALESMSHLMDQAASPEIESQIRTAIAANGNGALQAHDIRTRQAGSALFVEFHLVVPGSMSVYDAHVICDRIEDALEQEIAGSQIVIHVEPDNKAKTVSSGVVPL
ncbi:MAG: cation transporter [Hyphomicrobiaceae bacterium]|nr:cation transporter [Hyphomicrobiaceae bacterium]